jgi:predicted DNA binding CopG/RHH family protein
MKTMHRPVKDDQELLASIENGEWQSIKNIPREKKRYARIARLTLRKDKRINIRISEHDLSGIQALAVQEGIPYQTLLSSIIHKYVSRGLLAR